MVAERWVKLGKQLVETKDAVSMLNQLRDIAKGHPNRLRDAYKHVKQVAYGLEKCDEYREAMDEWLQGLVANAESGRVEVLNKFDACDSKRKLDIQKKLQMDGNSDGFFIDERDAQFVKDLKFEPQHLQDFKLTKAEWAAVRSRTSQRLEEKSMTVVHITNSSDLIKWARNMLRSPTSNAVELGVALAILTGRRLVEVYKTGSFEVKDGRLWFSGQAKVGLDRLNSFDANEDGAAAYRIPVLAKDTFIIDGLARLRQLVDSTRMTNTQVSAKWSAKCNTCVRDEIHPRMTFRDLRTMYVSMSHDWFKPHNYSLNVWGKKTLGHKGMHESVHYTTVDVNPINATYRRTTDVNAPPYIL